MTITNAVYHVPCQMLLERLPSEEVTIVYLDPPWALEGTQGWVYTDIEDPLEKYLDFLVEVLLQSRRVLALNGILFFHSEPRVTGYIRVILDQIFGSENFRSEFILPRHHRHLSRGPGIGHTSILMYSKSEDYIYNPPERPLTESEIQMRYRHRDERGPYYLRSPIATARDPSLVYEWQGILPPKGKAWTIAREKLQELYDAGRVDFSLSRRLPSLKVYLDEAPMTEVGTIWDDVCLSPGIEEREPFPSQQSIALLDRTIRVGSNPGNLVLDPFCGSGTTLVAAQEAERRWVGCDVLEEAYSITVQRLQESCDLIPGSDFEIGDHAVIKARYPKAHPIEQRCNVGVSPLDLGSTAQAELGESLSATSRDIASIPYIMTEGKTDWKHLKAAYTRLAQTGHIEDFEVKFHESEDDMGDEELLKVCQSHKRMPNERPIVCIFDRDNGKMVKKVTGQNSIYRVWGNRVFSLALPVPQHRKETPNISIELYYRDEEIKRTDPEGRRLYLSDEFDSESGRHVMEDVNCPVLNKVGRPATIIDDRVYDSDNNNIALPKSDFADYVLCQAPHFDDFDVSEFEKLFRLISHIIESELGQVSDLTAH